MNNRRDRGRDDKSGGVETTKTDMTSDSYTCSGTRWSGSTRVHKVISRATIREREKERERGWKRWWRNKFGGRRTEGRERLRMVAKSERDVWLEREGEE